MSRLPNVMCCAVILSWRDWTVLTKVAQVAAEPIESPYEGDSPHVHSPIPPGPLDNEHESGLQETPRRVRTREERQGQDTTGSHADFGTLRTHQGCGVPGRNMRGRWRVCATR